MGNFIECIVFFKLRLLQCSEVCFIVNVVKKCYVILWNVCERIVLFQFDLFQFCKLYVKLKFLLEIKFVLLSLFLIKSIVCCRFVMLLELMDILLCYKYFILNSNIFFLDFVCFEVKIINLEQGLFFVGSYFSFSKV